MLHYLQSAQDFAEWLNSLGSEDKSNINKEVIKELFSIGIEGDTSKALYVEPKLKKSVPIKVARSLNVPEVHKRLALKFGYTHINVLLVYTAFY